MKNIKEEIKLKDINEVSWKDITQLFDYHKITYKPYSKESLDIKCKDLNIDSFPSELNSYYLEVGKTACGITFFNNSLICEAPVEMMPLEDVHIQEINGQRYLLFARDKAQTIALFYDINNTKIIYGTDNSQSTFQDYFTNLKKAVINVEEVIQSLKYYSLKELEKDKTRSEASKYKALLMNKNIQDLSIHEISLFLDKYWIKREPYTKEYLDSICHNLQINCLPRKLEEYYLHIGESSISMAVPTKIQKPETLSIVKLGSHYYLRIIKDDKTLNEILVNVDDLDLDNPPIYRYFDPEMRIRQSDETLQTYFNYLWTTVTRNEEWINYLSNI